MDIEKTMVLIKGEDKTKFITSISCGPSPQIIIVEYNGGSSYSYNASNVTVLVDPESEDLDGRVAYYLLYWTIPGWNSAVWNL